MGKEFRCNECPGLIFTKYINLRNHYRILHPKLELPSIKKISVSKFICEECNTKFRFHISLLRHVKQFHSTRTSCTALHLTPKNFRCIHCSAEYTSIKNLTKHEQMKHRDSLPLMPKKFKCLECSAEYSSNRNLKRHERLKHNNLVKKLTTINCSLCSTSVTQKDDLFKHWKLDHAINIEIEELEFENKSMFFKWKSNIESDTSSKFVRNISGFSSKNGETFYFQCNRSGYFTSRSKGIRHLRTQRTLKINSICPARMKVRVFENGKHVVQFTKTHVGHGNDLEIESQIQKQCENLKQKNLSNSFLNISSPVISEKCKSKECNAEYTISKNFKGHERLKNCDKKGMSSDVKWSTVINCSLCSSIFTNKDDLFRHWKLDHEISIETEEIQLENIDSFFTWKNSIEVDTKSKYVRNISGFSSKSGKTTIYFQCNRSGYFTSRSRGLRQLKSQGTLKINSICPARMKVTVAENGKYVIKFTKTHIGHGQDFTKDNLKQNQCENFFTGIPVVSVLDSNSEALPVIIKNFKCNECSAQYISSKSLKRHVRLKHSSSVVKKFTIVKCSLCSTFFTQKVDLFKHWNNDHKIIIETEQFELENKNTFFTWKNFVEIDTKSKFVRNISGFLSKTGETLYYQCNRSGYFTSKSKGLRHLKTQGTCKINSICPAGMKVKVLENGKYMVQFTKTHIGHGHDLGHLSLTQHQREFLASKIASNVPFDEILNDIRESVEFGSPLSRIHLLTRKDLHNMKQSFNLISKAKDEIQQLNKVNVSEPIQEYHLLEEPQECNFIVEPISLEESIPVNLKEDNEVVYLQKSSETTTKPSTENTSIDVMKVKVNEFYQTLLASASSCEELVIIADLLRKAKPLIEAVRLNNSETV